jgi:hypothetical protein
LEFQNWEWLGFPLSGIYSRKKVGDRDSSLELVVIANTTSVGPFSEDNRLELLRRFTAALLLEPNFENLVKHAQEIDL